MMAHNKLIAMLLSILLLTVGPAAGGSEQDDSALVRAMFARMNLDHPGLEQVQAALARDDLPAAEAAYLRFWRERVDQVVLWNVFFRLNSVPMRNSGASDFFAAPAPVTISWRDREKVKDRISLGKVWANAERSCRWTVLEMADMLLEDKLTLIRLGDPGSGVFFMEPFDMGGKWDWNFIANDNPYE